MLGESSETPGRETQSRPLSEQPPRQRAQPGGQTVFEHDLFPDDVVLNLPGSDACFGRFNKHLGNFVEIKA